MSATNEQKWTIGDVEPLLHDLEATIGIFSHVANSRNQIEPGELILIEDKLLDLYKQMMALWRDAWDEHLSFRHGQRPASPPDAVWDLLRSTAEVVLAQYNHPERIPSAPAEGAATVPAADGQDAELIGLCNRLVEINREEEALYARIKDEAEREKAVEPLWEEFESIKLRLFEIGRPVTRAGAEAVARAAWVNGDRARDGTPFASYLSEWLRLAACAYLANATGPEVRVNAEVEESLTKRAAPANKAEPVRDADRPPTISQLDSLVECQAADIIVNAKALGGTMNGGISTIAAGLALALEQAHPGAALMLGRQASLVAATEPRGTVAEYMEKKLAKAATVEGQGMTNDELADLHACRPDATVLHLAREYMHLDARVQVLNECPDTEEVGMDGVMSRQNAVMDTLIDAPAKTAAGWRAKGEVFEAALRADVTSLDPVHRLALSLAEDLMREIKP
jgi:hypothetical protein